MLSIFYRDVKKKQLEQLEKLRSGSWIHVQTPSADEFDYLIEQLKLDPGLLQDAVDMDEVPRMEVEDGILYVFTRFATQKNGQIETMPIMIAVGKNFVLTVSTVACPPIDRFIDHAAFYTTQKTKLVLQLFSQIATSYTKYLNQISRQIRANSFQVEKIDNDDIIQFVGFEIVLNDFLLALVRKNGMLKNFLTGKYLGLYEEDRDLIEDIFLNNEQQIEICKENLRNMVNIREAYSTIMTNNLNRVIKLFTTLTIILTIPTIIASMFGMNVKLPLEGHPFAFFIILGMTMLISLVLVFIFFKNKWL